jgi:hypothetical protein
MPDDGKERSANLHDVERRLTDELDEARANYELADLEFRGTARQARDLGLDTIDGSHLLYKASGAERLATAAYTRAVKRFCDFVLKGIVPED